MTNEPRRITLTFATLVLAALVAGAEARADVTISIEQQGSNVVESGSGSINLTGLTFDMTRTILTNVDPAHGVAYLGLVGTSASAYTGFTGPASFGTGTTSTATTTTGPVFGVGGTSSYLFVPQGYVSETALSSTDTFNNTNFTNLGLTAGTYTYRWGTGSDQSLTVQIGTAAVPEPSTAILAMIGAVGFGTYRWLLHRRHQRRQEPA